MALKFSLCSSPSCFPVAGSTFAAYASFKVLRVLASFSFFFSSSLRASGPIDPPTRSLTEGNFFIIASLISFSLAPVDARLATVASIAGCISSKAA